MINKLNKILLLLLVISFISSCVTTKKKDDEQSWLKQFYHNTTAEFNGYFNADVIMQESYAQLNQEHQDNYTKLLPVYEYVAVEDAKSVSPELDRAIEKVSIVVSLHRQSDWTDDCYLLLGQAQYLKKDYESAEETFEFMMDEFNPIAMAKNKAKAIKKSKKGPSRSKKIKENKKENKDKAKERDNTRKEKEKTAKQKKKEADKARKDYNKKVKKAKAKGKKAPPRPKTPKKDATKTGPSAVDAAKEANKKAEEEKNKDKKKEEKKKDESPLKPEEKGGLFKKDPAYQEARLWMARTYVERDKFTLAESIFNELENSSNTFDEVRRELSPARAYFHLEQKQYNQAIPHLEKAIDLSKKRNDKARYAYIIAQIHQMNNKSGEAYAYFQKAMKFSNDYEMEFSAKLSMAQNSYQTGKSTPEQTIKALKKLLKDEKNEEYKDQIYYALANVALDNNQRLDAISYLENSLACGSRNQVQRSESYLKLADLYFEEESYVKAKNYYDSTLVVLSKTDERFDRVNSYRDNLNEIAENIEIITLQDSLLAISNMTEREKRKLAAKLKEENAKAQPVGNGLAVTQPFDKTGRRGGVSGSNRQLSRNTVTLGGGISDDTGTSFPLYDERILKKGKKDFSKRWGTRKLEDDWRRSSRQGAGDIVDEEITNQADDLSINDEEVARILKGVPTTPEAVEKANTQIADAMMNLGRLYRERLEKNDKTVDVLEDQLLQRYPETVHQMDAWYYLYLAHKSLGNNAKAQGYADKIVEKYPESTYARVIQDPSYIANSQAEKKRIIDFYNDTYNIYQKGDFESAFARIQKATNLFGNGNVLQAKFSLLAALCTGNLKGKKAYAESLKEVIAKYPATEEEKRAKEILRLLDGKPLESAGGEAAAKLNAGDAKKFKPEDDKIHYMVIVVNNKGEAKVSDAKSALANYNRKFYNLEKLRVSNIYLGTDTSRPIMVIRKFKNKERAMEYYSSSIKAGKDFLPSGMTFDMYPVTQNNYRQILKDKSMAGYDNFFQSNYMN